MNFGIIVAGGKSERMGPDVDKAFLNLGTKPVLAYSVLAFEKCHDIDGVILVVRKDRLDSARAMAQMYGCAKVKRVVAGGTSRQGSVMNGLAHVSEDAKIVAVHDGARPCITSAYISEIIKTARRCGSAVAATKITDTIKFVEKGFTISKTIDRTNLWSVQTPQAFRMELLKKAFDFVRKKGLSVTDEASAVEHVSDEVHLVPTLQPNIKITTADDLVVAATLLRL
ncbi:MAG: 2-C-methyl-D-erythritol 4-phosphate cytidylyltransferase [Verrucomicrobia bacterium]|nr:2-C-methyl-D-erythritol 4-phosphate cytidylyltransferase [Verrucomicrobiota bacterium]